MSFVDGAQGTQPGSEPVENENPGGQPVEQQEPESGGELANPFLANVAEEDREVVARYIKQWDAGVTRRFQENAQKYKPYEELGSPEELKKDREIAQFLRDNPDQVYSMLHEQYGSKPTAQQTPQQPSAQNFSLTDLPEDLAPLAQALQQLQEQNTTKFTGYETKIGSLEKTLNIVAEYVVNQMESEAKKREDQELADYMTNLHTEFGDFDDEYVLTKIANGVTPDKAVQQYKSIVQAQVNQTRKPDPSVPVVLSGGGGTPPAGKKPAEMSQDETKQLVAAVLARAAQES